MSEFQSRLPDDPWYWNRLAARVVHSAEPILREHRDTRAWWQPLARWSPAIAAAAVAAVLLAFVIGPPPRPPSRVAFHQLLGPRDPVSQAVVGGIPATDVSAILLIESGGLP